MTKTMKEYVPETSMDFIQDVYDIKNYILYNKQDREANFKPNEAQEKALRIVRKIEYIAIMINLDNLFEIGGFKKKIS